MKRVILTHYHPDHAGNAAWLCQRFGVELWTTQGEYLTAHAVRASSAGYTTDAVLSVFQKNGLDRAARLRACRRSQLTATPRWCRTFRIRTAASSTATRCSIGSHELARDHRPRPCARASVAVFGELNTLIAGDMLLSTISTNVSVWSIDPEGDPLRLFLDSIARYRELPADVLVLPSHGKPFRGAHERVAQLEAASPGPLRRADGESLEEKPKSAAELLPVLFRRPLDAHQTFFAMGEAIAHLHYLYYAGRAKRAAGRRWHHEICNPLTRTKPPSWRRSRSRSPSARPGSSANSPRSRPRSMSSAVRDEMGIAKAFMDLYARMAADPALLASSR